MYNLTIPQQSHIIKNYTSVSVYNIAEDLKINETCIRTYIKHAQSYLKGEIKEIAKTDKLKAKVYQDKYNKFFAKSYPFIYV